MNGPDPATEAWSGTITRYAAGIGLAILLYDLLITMEKEVSGRRTISLPYFT